MKEEGVERGIASASGVRRADHQHGITRNRGRAGPAPTLSGRMPHMARRLPRGDSWVPHRACRQGREGARSWGVKPVSPANLGRYCRRFCRRVAGPTLPSDSQPMLPAPGFQLLSINQGSQSKRQGQGGRVAQILRAGAQAARPLPAAAAARNPAPCCTIALGARSPAAPAASPGWHACARGWGRSWAGRGQPCLAAS